MNRTAERVLGIISLVFTVLGVISTIGGAVILKMMGSDPSIRSEIEGEILSNPSTAPGDMDMFFQFFDAVGGFLWLGVAFLVLSLILTIVALVNIWNNKNPKLAGIMFILAGLTGGILSLTSILLYIAGILCLTKKPTMIYTDEHNHTDTPYDDNGMRPL
ncbi:DUF4064 domain-containing protein [Sporosarcina sp. A2]|uniref:DUF4064 domain-containing protein n=1 Tax=Sporosarcina sp. A2 TaxID=3393449 RepID=UPI003D78B593